MFNIQDNSIIEWAGWWTTWHALRKEGWIITIKPKYENWRRPNDSETSIEKVYIRHPKTRMIGRISKDNNFEMTNNDYTLDYLSQEHNWKIKAPKILEKQEITPKDIPALLEIILKLQEQTPKRKTQESQRYIKTAELLLFNKIA